MKKEKSKVRVALIQLPCLDGQVEKNFQNLLKLFKKIKKPVDLIVLPEMWPSGFRVLGGAELLKKTEAVLRNLEEIARKKKCFIVGSHLSRAKKGYYNTASVMSPQGKMVGQYHKVHLFQLGGENKKFISGKEVSVVKTRIGKLGLSICYDIRFPEFIRKEVLLGAQVLVIPSGWPTARIEHYRALLKVRAIENLCFVLSSNRVGKNADGVEYGGHSVALDPWGKVLGEMGYKAGVLEVEIDLKQVQEIRKKFPVFAARREEVY